MQQWGGFLLTNVHAGICMTSGVTISMQSWQALAEQLVRHIAVDMLLACCAQSGSAGTQAKLYQTYCIWEIGSMLRTFLP